MGHWTCSSLERPIDAAMTLQAPVHRDARVLMCHCSGNLLLMGGGGSKTYVRCFISLLFRGIQSRGTRWIAIKVFR